MLKITVKATALVWLDILGDDGAPGVTRQTGGLTYEFSKFLRAQNIPATTVYCSEGRWNGGIPIDHANAVFSWLAEHGVSGVGALQPDRGCATDALSAALYRFAAEQYERGRTRQPITADVRSWPLAARLVATILGLR